MLMLDQTPVFEADTTGERMESGGQTMPVRPAERLVLWYHKTSSRARSRAGWI